MKEPGVSSGVRAGAGTGAGVDAGVGQGTDGDSEMAWCNAAPNPKTGIMGSVAVTCECFDGYVGDYCHTRVRQFCLNDCGYNGECEHGHCRCRRGYFGADCSQLVGGGLAPVGIGSAGVV